MRGILFRIVYARGAIPNDIEVRWDQQEEGGGGVYSESYTRGGAIPGGVMQNHTRESRFVTSGAFWDNSDRIKVFQTPIILTQISLNDSLVQALCDGMSQ